VGKRQETLFLSTEEKGNWIEIYMDKETTWAGAWDKDVERVIMVEQEDMENAEKAGSATRQRETAFEKMLYAIRNSLSDLASSEGKEDV